MNAKIGYTKVGGIFLEYKPLSLVETRKLLEKTKKNKDQHINAFIWCRLQEGIVELVGKDPNVKRINEKIEKLDKIWKKFLKDDNSDIRSTAREIHILIHY